MPQFDPAARELVRGRIQNRPTIGLICPGGTVRGVESKVTQGPDEQHSLCARWRQQWCCISPRSRRRPRNAACLERIERLERLAEKQR